MPMSLSAWRMAQPNLGGASTAALIPTSLIPIPTPMPPIIVGTGGSSGAGGGQYSHLTRRNILIRALPASVMLGALGHRAVRKISGDLHLPLTEPSLYGQGKRYIDEIIKKDTPFFIATGEVPLAFRDTLPQGVQQTWKRYRRHLSFANFFKPSSWPEGKLQDVMKKLKKKPCEAELLPIFAAGGGAFALFVYNMPTLRRTSTRRALMYNAAVAAAGGISYAYLTSIAK